MNASFSISRRPEAEPKDSRHCALGVRSRVRSLGESFASPQDDVGSSKFRSKGNKWQRTGFRYAQHEGTASRQGPCASAPGTYEREISRTAFGPRRSSFTSTSRRTGSSSTVPFAARFRSQQLSTARQPMGRAGGDEQCSMQMRIGASGKAYSGAQ